MSNDESEEGEGYTVYRFLEGKAFQLEETINLKTLEFLTKRREQGKDWGI